MSLESAFSSSSATLGFAERVNLAQRSLDAQWNGDTSFLQMANNFILNDDASELSICSQAGQDSELQPGLWARSQVSF